jgi:hypothetical protein
MARACVPFLVRNTFITVGEEEVLDDIGPVKIRQMTEPAYLHNGDATTEPEQEPSMDSLPSWSAVVLEEERESDVLTAQVAPIGSTVDQDTEYEIEEFDTGDWDRIVTGFEFGVQPSMAVCEERAVTAEDQLLHALTVGQSPGWMFGYSNYETWQATFGCQDMSAPTVHSNADFVSQPPPEWARVTTVMMRNLPNKYTQGMLLDEINAAGFSKAYDFLYLPIEPETRSNRGYAFINFRDARLSWNFKVHFDSHHMNHSNSHKSITVVPAALQGFDANYQHYSKCRASKSAPEMRPLFFRDVGHVGSTRHKRGGKPSLIDLAARQKVTINQKEEVPQFCYSCGDAAGPAFKFCRSCGTCLQSRA